MPSYKKTETKLRGYIEPLTASAVFPVGGIPIKNTKYERTMQQLDTKYERTSNTLTITQPVACETCKGEGSLDTYTPCPTCHGKRIK